MPWFGHPIYHSSLFVPVICHTIYHSSSNFASTPNFYIHRFQYLNHDGHFSSIFGIVGYFWCYLLIFMICGRDCTHLIGGSLLFSCFRHYRYNKYVSNYYIFVNIYRKFVNYISLQYQLIHYYLMANCFK